jgi:multicomponent Na+:H+ antiporter subunit D
MGSMEQMPAIIVVIPLMTSFLVFLIGWPGRQWAWPLVMVALTACLVSAGIILTRVWDSGLITYRLSGWPPPIGIAYRIDHLTAGMLVLVAFLSFITAIYGRLSVEKELADKVVLFWTLYLLLVTGLLGIVITADLFNLFVLLEVASLSGYALVAIGRGKAAFVSFRYLIIGTIGAAFYLLGVGYLYICTGSLNMEDLRILLPALYDSRIVRTAYVFFFIGFAIKIALFPLHAWQPDAYTFAPSAITILISTAMAKTFAYGMIRVMFSVFTVQFLTGFNIFLELMCWMAAMAMVAGSVFAITQHNLKRMLAYSSVANVGYIVLAVGLAPSTPLGLTPAVMHMVNHAIIKGCMFMTACAFIHQLGLTDIRQFTGLGRKMPWTCLAFVTASLAMIGMPPSAGFVTKWFLIAGALDAGRFIFVAVVFVSTLLMIGYFWRVIEVMMIRVPETAGPTAPIRPAEAAPGMLLPSLLLAVMTFAMGIVWMTGAMSPLTGAINAELGLGGGGLP